MKFFGYDLINYKDNTYFLNTPSHIINHYICFKIENEYTDIYTFDSVCLEYWRCFETSFFDEQKILTILKYQISGNYREEFDKLFGKYYIWL
jgi:hypothetical protein